MPLGDFPIIGAGIARRAGVGQHDPLFQLPRIDVDGRARDTGDAQLDGRDAAVQRRPIILDAGRHPNRLALDVHRHLQQMFGIGRRLRPARQGAADGDGQRRGSGNPRARRRLAARGQRRVLQAVVPGQQREQRQVVAAVQLAPVFCAGRAIGVHRAQLDVAVVSRGDLDVRPQADRRVQRGRAFVKEVQRPDVDGAAGQVDAGRSGRSQTHGQL